MYKTVRKGDASLQYTILPQTDQFTSNGFSQTSSVGITNGKPRSRILKYTICTLLLLIILSCVATPFLINQNDRNLFAGTILVMGRVGYDTTTTKTSTTGTTSTTSTTIKSTTIENASKSDRTIEEEEDEEEEDEEDEEEEIIEKNEYQVPVTTSRPKTTMLIILTSTNGVQKSKDLEDRTIPIDSFREDEIDPVDTVTPEEAVGNVADEIRIPTDSVTNARQTGFYSTQQSSYPSSSPSSFTASSKFFSSSIEPSEMTKMASARKAAKMPRVTLKLRENETIPQMYMKAGIASYKKGNITTSVLAHGLSLEGLIFKTPEGTIKPWPQKWFFSDPSSDFQWKGPNQMPMIMYIVLAGLAGLASLSIVLMFYVQRKASKRQRHDVEEPETESHEEDKSTLLGADSQEIEDKE